MPDAAHLAALARIGLSPDEQTRLDHALDAALGEYAALAEAGRALAAQQHVADAAAATDEDEPVAEDAEAPEDGTPGEDQTAPGPPALAADEAQVDTELAGRILALAPAHVEGHYEVPRVPHGQGRDDD